MAKFLKYLRIAFSAFCVIAYVLLVALWVRSYWWDEELVVPLPGNQSIFARSLPGSYMVVVNPDSRMPPWTILGTPTDQLGTPESPIWGAFDVHTAAVLIPYWFSLLVTASIAAFPWLRWRFSLRALLITITLVAVLLGIIVWRR